MKKILKISFLIMLIISIFQMNSLYAMYKNLLEGNYDYIIGDWTIVINGNLLKNDEENNIEIDSNGEYFEYESNQYILDGKMAPTRVGNAYFYIDATGTDVSVMYDIILNSKDAKVDDDGNNVSNIQLIEISNYFIKEGEEAIQNENSISLGLTTSAINPVTHKGVFPIDKIQGGYINVVKVKVKWENDESKNLEDTQIGEINNASFSFPAKITLKQYTGETIVE